MTITKENSQSFSEFTVMKRSGMFDIISIAESILNWEARLGDSNPETFMIYYPNLRIQKLKQGDGSKIYTIADRETKEEFMFASRSLSWPAGYGFDQPLVKGG